MKISNTILAVFQQMNEMSAIVANNFIANLDYFFMSVLSLLPELPQKDAHFKSGQ